MADEQSKVDQNYVAVALAVTDNESQDTVMLRVDATTGRLLCDLIIE